MDEHDPLCPQRDVGHALNIPCGYCEVIREARAQERARSTAANRERLVQHAIEALSLAPTLILAEKRTDANDDETFMRRLAEIVLDSIEPLIRADEQKRQWR